MADTARSHYNGFLAGKYSWISGDPGEQVRTNREFFSGHAIKPGNNKGAVDLGAGCGFQSVALAQLGYSVTSVDFCDAMLEELRIHAGTLPVETIKGDIRDYSLWSGRQPALITCMGDTLTHLRSSAEAEDLIGHCYGQLVRGGRLILSLRDYSVEPAEAVVVIPVHRDASRIFLCRLEYHAGSVTVRDIFYSDVSGRRERTAGQYPKIRIAPGDLGRMLAGAGFVKEFVSADNGSISVIARKDE
jgi:SAM-dependent methyltransferase